MGFNAGDGVVDQDRPLSFIASAAAHSSALFVFECPFRSITLTLRLNSKP